MFTGPQHTWPLRGNLRLLLAMRTEADTCLNLALQELQTAGWDNEPHSIAAQRWFARKPARSTTTHGVEETAAEIFDVIKGA